MNDGDGITNCGAHFFFMCNAEEVDGAGRVPFHFIVMRRNLRNTRTRR